MQFWKESVIRWGLKETILMVFLSVRYYYNQTNHSKLKCKYARDFIKELLRNIGVRSLHVSIRNPAKERI